MSKRRWGLVGVAYGVVLCCVQGVFAGGLLEWETTIELQSVDPIAVLEESAPTCGQAIRNWMREAW